MVGKSQRPELAEFSLLKTMFSAVYSAIVAEDGLQEIRILVVSHYHSVILMDSSTGGRRIGWADVKAVWQDLSATAKVGRG